MAVSKVIFDNEVVIDLTSDTVTPQSMLRGVTAHAADGEQITGDVILGALAALDYISYTSDYLRNKPTLGSLASMNSIDYASNYLTNKPGLKNLAFLDYIDYASNYLRNKPEALSELFNKILREYPNIPLGIILFVFAQSEILRIDSPIVSYSNETLITTTQEYLGFSVSSETFKITINDSFPSGNAEIIGGALAALDFIDYSSNYLTNKPSLGSLASMNSINYESNYLTNKPTLKSLASMDYVDYGTDYLRNKPNLRNLAFVDYIDYESNYLKNKPASYKDLMDRIVAYYPEIPKGILLIIYSYFGILRVDTPSVSATVTSSKMICSDSDENEVYFNYVSSTETLRALSGDKWFAESNLKTVVNSKVDEAPSDGKKYVRKNGEWVQETQAAVSNNIDVSSLGSLAFRDSLSYSDLTGSPNFRVTNEVLKLS